MLALKDVGLVSGGRWLKPIGPDTFTPLGSEGSRIRVERRGDEVARIIVTRFTAEYSYYRFTKPVTKPVPPREIGGSAVLGSTKLAVVSRTGWHGCGRWTAATPRLEPQDRPQCPLENADPRPRPFVSSHLGKPRFPHHRH